MPSSRLPGQRYPSDDTPEYRHYRSQWENNKHRQRRLAVLMAYGGKCVCCGETELVFLGIDHVENDAKERVARGEPRRGNALIRWLMKHDFPSGFQVLCCNCNRAKHYVKVCPHKPS